MQVKLDSVSMIRDVNSRWISLDAGGVSIPLSENDCVVLGQALKEMAMGGQLRSKVVFETAQKAAHVQFG